VTTPEFDNLVGLLGAGRIGPETPLDQARGGYDAMGTMIPLVEGTTTEAIDPATGVRGEWVQAPDGDDGRVLVWFHGGGYVIGSATSHRPLASRLSSASRSRVLLVDYRLAPEHPAPAALDDALAAYEHVLESGVRADRVALGGDSAGGGLALCSVLALRDRHIDLPAAMALSSPWVDLSLVGDSITANADTDIILSAELLAYWADAYLDGHDARRGPLAPLSGDGQGLPPMLVHVARGELLHDDAVALTTWARAAGNDVSLTVDDEMIHHWHVWAGLFPEADRAVDELGTWLDGHLA
jgi:acetyl esterase/lipase